MTSEIADDNEVSDAVIGVAVGGGDKSVCVVEL